MFSVYESAYPHVSFSGAPALRSRDFGSSFSETSGNFKAVFKKNHAKSLKIFDRKSILKKKVENFSKISKNLEKSRKSRKIEKVGFQLTFSSIFRDFQDFSTFSKKIDFFKIDFRSKIFNLFH